MTDNEIIKALKSEADYNCDMCCNNNENCMEDDCGKIISENTLDLINRQKAEIYRHKAEIRRLAEYNENLRCENYNLEDALLFGIKKAKSEAIREFAEKLKERNEDFCVDKSDMAFVVDSIVKEMTEGENG